MLTLSGRQNTKILQIFNSLTHYSSFVYSFSIPIISPLCFPEHTCSSAIAKGYLLYLFGSLAKPLGIICFSNMSDKKNIQNAVRYAILGASVSSILTVSVIYCSILQILLVPVLYTAHSFFGSGAKILIKTYNLSTKTDKFNTTHLLSYQIYSLVGIIAATFCVMYTDNIHRDVLLKFWPLLLLPEGLGVLLAALIKKEPENQRQNTGSLFLVLQKIKKNFTLFIQICILHSFDHFTYYFAFVFINSFIPMLTGKITYSCMLKYNAAFMIFDLLLSIALIQYKKSITLVKKISAILPFCICICCIALVPLTMATHSIFIVLVIRMLIVFMGTICSCMFCNLAFQKSKKISEDTTFVGFSFSYLIGSTLGKNFTPAAFFLFETTQNPYSPIMLSCLICVISGICAFYLNKK